MQDDFIYYRITEKNPVYIKLKQNDNNIFYHYTDKAGINGILKSSSFWVTNCYYLDDISEIKYMSKVIDGVIKLIEAQKYFDIIGTYIINHTIETLKALRRAYKNGAPLTGSGIYILSLTENKDNKYLKSNYCKEGGAIIEFRKNANYIFNKSGYIHQYCSAYVVYGLINQIQILLKDIDEFCNELLFTLYRQKVVDYNEVDNTIERIISLKILNYSFFFKDANYINEEEYRIVFTPIDYNIVKYRRESNKPYIEVFFNKKDINVTYI